MTSWHSFPLEVKTAVLKHCITNVLDVKSRGPQTPARCVENALKWWVAFIAAFPEMKQEAGKQLDARVRDNEEVLKCYKDDDDYYRPRIPFMVKCWYYQFGIDKVGGDEEIAMARQMFLRALLPSDERMHWSKD